MNKYLIILGSALNPSIKQTTAFGQERVKQYIQGFERIAELCKEMPYFDYVLVDNTIPQGWKMPEEISRVIEKIPNFKKIMFLENQLAAINKGCGVAAGWKKMVKEIDITAYEYCLYFEPRQYLKGFDFFRNFLNKPANYFQIQKYRITAQTHGSLVRMFFKAVPIHRRALNNGLFSIKPGDFLKYINEADLQLMADKKISLEDDMYNKLKNLPHISVKRLGYVWHNAFLGKDVEV